MSKNVETRYEIQVESSLMWEFMDDCYGLEASIKPLKEFRESDPLSTFRLIRITTEILDD